MIGHSIGFGEETNNFFVKSVSFTHAYLEPWEDPSAQAGI